MSVQRQQVVANGRLNGHAEKMACMNPGTGEQFAEVTMATAAEVSAARQEMGVAAQVWGHKLVAERVRIVRQLQSLIIEEMDELTAVINQDGGKSRQDALTELFVTVDSMNQYCRHAAQWLRPRRVSSGLQLFKRGQVERRPYGVVAVISPWNYPFILTMQPVITALLAGNTVVVKPSEVTAATGVAMEKLFQRLPELAPFVRFVHGDSRVGAALVQTRPDLIYVTGSVRTGRLITQAAAETMTPVITELGSKDPMIVLDDADITAAARWGVWGAFYNAGQTCVAVERVYVLESVYEPFVQAVLAEVANMKVGYSPAIDNGFDMGPLTFARQGEIIDAHLADAVAKGAKIVAGGGRSGYFMEPTVVVDVDHTMLLMQDETFGPILPIMKVADISQAVRLANDSYLGLGASVWGQDVARAERVAQRLETGSVNINDTVVHFAIPHLPFGGVKQSGNGRSHGEADLLQFTQMVSYAIGKPPLPFDIATILRSPGNYHKSAAIMKLAFGTTPQQRLEPVTEFLQENKGKVAMVGGITAVVLASIRLVKYWWAI
ncbi:MAG: aldehyde dehydrogenase family protein [Anaerolineales bacterium]|nr:aldehyde dehydrogenase family protein [Anaerolineales bacterium]